MGIYKRNKYWKPTAPKSQNYNLFFELVCPLVCWSVIYCENGENYFCGGKFLCFHNQDMEK